MIECWKEKKLKATRAARQDAGTECQAPWRINGAMHQAILSVAHLCGMAARCAYLPGAILARRSRLCVEFEKKSDL